MRCHSTVEFGKVFSRESYVYSTDLHLLSFYISLPSFPHQFHFVNTGIKTKFEITHCRHSRLSLAYLWVQIRLHLPPVWGQSQTRQA
jgi:hypothetical protein